MKPNFVLRPLLSGCCLLAAGLCLLVSAALGGPVYFPIQEMTGLTNDTVVNVRAVNNPTIYNGRFYYLPAAGTNLTTSGGYVTNTFVPGVYTVTIGSLAQSWTMNVTNNTAAVSAAALSHGVTIYSGIQSLTGYGSATVTNDALGNYSVVGSSGTGGTMSDAEFAARMSTNAAGFVGQNPVTNQINSPTGYVALMTVGSLVDSNGNPWGSSAMSAAEFTARVRTNKTESTYSGEISTNLVFNPLALTSRMPVPPRVWGSWQDFPCAISGVDLCWRSTTNVIDSYFREQVRWYATNGMRDAGLRYILIEEGPFTGVDGNGALIVNSARYPSGLTNLCDYIRSLGFIPGFYLSVGPRDDQKTCEMYVGTSYKNLNTHVQQIANWGGEFIFIDTCGALNYMPTNGIIPQGTVSDEPYLIQRERLIAQAIQKTGKNIGWLSTMQYFAETGNGRYPNLYQTHNVTMPQPAADDRYDFVLSKSNPAGGLNNIFLRTHTNSLESWYTYTYPGHYFYQGLINEQLDVDEWRGTFLLQCMTAGAIWLESETHRVYSVGDSNVAVYLGPYANPQSTWYSARTFIATNQEIAAIHQDPSVIPGQRIWSNNLAQIWWRPVGWNAATKGGSDDHALLFANFASTNQTITVPFSLFSASNRWFWVRDVVTNQWLVATQNFFTATITPSNTMMYRFVKTNAPVSVSSSPLVQTQYVDLEGCAIFGTGVSKLTDTSYSAAPVYGVNGIQQSAANATDMRVQIAVPRWATNVTMTYWAHSGAGVAVSWTNEPTLDFYREAGRAQFNDLNEVGLPRTACHTTANQVVACSNFWTWAFTNAPKVLDLRMNPSTNSGARYVVGPVECIWRGWAN